MSRQIFSISIILVFIVTAVSFAADPNLVGWWKLDSNANDSSDNGNDGTIYGDPIWETGRIDGALDLDGDGDYVNIASSSFDLETHTTSFWIKPNTLGYKIAIEAVKGTTRAFGYIGLSGEGQVRHFVRSGTLSSTSKIDALTGNLVEVGNWYHIVSIMGVAGNKLYVNGTQQTLSYLNGSPSSTEGWSIINGGNGPDNLNIGSLVYDGVGNEFFDGLIDDVRIYGRLLNTNEILQLCAKGYGGKACAPNPYNGQTMVDPNIILSWYPGTWTADVNGHDVYFGTDYNDVNDANTAITLGVYQGRQDANFWDPCGLERAKWYYWRVDEVNDSNNDSPWKGNVWSFETAAPSIELSASQFNFNADHGGSNPDDQILSIHNGGPGTVLNWTISYDCNWLTVEPNSGTCSGDEVNEVILSVDITDLPEGTYECDLTVSDPCAENSPQIVNVTLTDGCFPFNHPDYDEWVDVGKPECWCYPRQCHGDADGLKEGSNKLGYWYVGDADLNILILAWKVKEPPEGPGIDSIPDGICTDFFHDKEGSAKLGYWRVGDNELGALIPNWKVKEAPDGSGVPPNCP